MAGEIDVTKISEANKGPVQGLVADLEKMMAEHKAAGVAESEAKIAELQARIDELTKQAETVQGESEAAVIAVIKSYFAMGDF